MSFNSSGPTTAATVSEARKSDQLAGSIASEFKLTTTPTQAFNWRDHLDVHPAAETFPLLSEKELKELAGDIKRNGLQVGITLWRPDDKTKPVLLDGRNRLNALAMLGLLAVDKRGQLCIKHDGELRELKKGIVGGNPEKHAHSLNLHRRHLTPEKKRELIARVLKERPEASDRSIAKQLKVVSDKTVGTVRRAEEARAEIPHVETRTDTKGRKQPAKKKTPRKPSAPKPEREAKQKKIVERRELEAAHAHIDELEAAREHDKDLAEKLRMAENKIVGLEGEIEDLKRENAELRQQLETAQVRAVPPNDDGLDIPPCLRRAPKEPVP